MYLDPGFGSMVIQVVFGIIAAGGVALYALRQKIAKFFGRSPNENEQGKIENQKNEQGI